MSGRTVNRGGRGGRIFSQKNICGWGIIGGGHVRTLLCKPQSDNKAMLKETQTDLVGFAGEATKPLGKFKLEVCFRSKGLCRRTTMKFTIIRAPSPFNIILGRTSLRTLRAIPSTIHSMMKFPTLKGIATLVTRSVIISECRQLEKKQEPANITGVPWRVIEHNLNVNASIEPERQKRRILTPEKSDAVAKDPVLSDRLGTPPEFPIWYLSKNMTEHGECAACPKDFYPLPNIDCKVESVMGFKYKYFLDAYKGYHKIQMSKEDEEKTAFYTDQGTYCYTKMSFRLKNAGATYQRLIDSTFQSQIGRNLEAYMDDMVIKSNDKKTLLADVAETFDNLRKINMKLNPKKCSFGVEESKFLGYMVTSEGIRANPKKTRILADLQSPRTLKEMQSLARKLAALNRFLAKSSEKSIHFFNTLKNIMKENKHEYKWTIKAKEAFQQMKRCIINLPSLTPSFPKETLYAYLTVSKEAVSSVLLTDRKGKQSPIHYVSRTLNEAERNYTPMEKLALSLVHMTRRLRRYFEAHPVKVITNQPIKQILNQTKASWKLEKYVIVLGEYNITFEPRNSVKGQVLAYFITETPNRWSPEGYFRTLEVAPERDDTQERTLFTDGASSVKESSAGIVLIGPSGVEHTYALRLTFDITNNEVEYKSLLARLRIAKGMNIQKLEAKVDSKLVASQINGNYVANNDSMMKYLTKAKEYIACFKSFSIKNILRNQNQKADVLSKLSSVAFNHLTKEVLVEVLNERSTEVEEINTVVEEE
ncbi:reverse transcriptase domain-containing protein [Tanacetum coccineum]